MVAAKRLYGCREIDGVDGLSGIHTSVRSIALPGRKYNG